LTGTIRPERIRQSWDEVVRVIASIKARNVSPSLILHRLGFAAHERIARAPFGELDFACEQRSGAQSEEQKRRAELDSAGSSEDGFLNPLRELGEAIDLDKAREYAAHFEDLPPITVQKDSFVVIDGRHRLEAAQIAAGAPWPETSATMMPNRSTPMEN
jgi:hypothetical protein